MRVKGRKDRTAGIKNPLQTPVQVLQGLRQTFVRCCTSCRSAAANEVDYAANVQVGKHEVDGQLRQRHSLLFQSVKEERHGQDVANRSAARCNCLPWNILDGDPLSTDLIKQGKEELSWACGIGAMVIQLFATDAHRNPRATLRQDMDVAQLERFCAKHSVQGDGNATIWISLNATRGGQHTATKAIDRLASIGREAMHAAIQRPSADGHPRKRRGSKAFDTLQKNKPSTSGAWAADGVPMPPVRLVQLNAKRFTNQQGQSTAEAIGEALASLRPSLVAFNEVDVVKSPQALQQISERLGMRAEFFGHVRGRYGNALLSAFPVVSVAQHHLRGGTEIKLPVNTPKFDGTLARAGPSLCPIRNLAPLLDGVPLTAC